MIVRRAWGPPAAVTLLVLALVLAAPVARAHAAPLDDLDASLNRLFLERARGEWARAESQRQAVAAARRAGTRPSLLLARYAGTYTSALYEPVRVALEDGRLVLHRSRVQAADLEHRDGDTFLLRFRQPADALQEQVLAKFAVRDGRVAGLSDDPFEYRPAR